MRVSGKGFRRDAAYRVKIIKKLCKHLKALLKAVQPVGISYMSLQCPACRATELANKKLTEANFRHEEGCVYVAAREALKEVKAAQ